MAGNLISVTGGAINGQWPWGCDVNGLYYPTSNGTWRNDHNSVIWKGSWVYGDRWMITPFWFEDSNHENGGYYYTEVDFNSPWGPDHYRSDTTGDLTGDEVWTSAGANCSNADPPPTLSFLPVPEPWDPYGWWAWITYGDAPYFGPNASMAPCAAVLAGKNYLVLPANQRIALAVDGFVLWQMDGRHQFSMVNLSGAMFGGTFTFPECDVHNRGGAFDAGDGEHIYVNGGAWENGETHDWQFTFKTFSVTPGGSATETDSVTVSLPCGTISNFVEVATGEYRFVLVNGGNVYFCSYSAGDETYTAGTGVALPALPQYYEDVVLDGTGPFDQALLKVGSTYYWFRDIHRGTMDRRALPHEIADGVLTPLSDVIEIADPIVTNDQAGSAYGAYAGTVYGHFGKDSYNDAGIVWTPGSNGLPGYEEGYPCARAWFVLAGNGQLYLMGWCDESYEHRPFVSKISPTPVTVSHGVMAEWSGGMAEVEATTRLRADAHANTSGEIALEIGEAAPVELTVAGSAHTLGAIVLAHGLEVAGAAHTQGAVLITTSPLTLLGSLSGEANTNGAGALDVAGAVHLSASGHPHTSGAAQLRSQDPASIAGLSGLARTSGRAVIGHVLSPSAGESHTTGAVKIGRTLLVAGAATTEGDADLAHAFTGKGAARTTGQVQLAHALKGAGVANARGTVTLWHGLQVAGQADATGAAVLQHGLKIAGAARTSGEALLAHGLKAAGAARTTGTALLRRGLLLAGAAHTTGAVRLAHALKPQGAAQTAGEVELAHGLRAAGKAAASGSCELAHGLQGAGVSRTSGQGAIGRVLLVVGASHTTGEGEIAHGLKAAGAAHATGAADLQRGLAGAGVARTAGRVMIALQPGVAGNAHTGGAARLAHGVVCLGAAHTSGRAQLQVAFGVGARGAAKTAGAAQLAHGLAGVTGAAHSGGRVTLAHGLQEAAGIATATGNAVLQRLFVGMGEADTTGEVELARGVRGAGLARTSGRVELAHSLSGAGEAETGGQAGLYHLLPKIGQGQAATVGEVTLLIAPGAWSPLPRRHMDVWTMRPEQEIILEAQGLNVKAEAAVMDLL